MTYTYMRPGDGVMYYNRGVVSQHALQVSRPKPGGGEVEGIWPGGSPGPHPRGKLRGIWPGGVSRPTPGGSPGPYLGGFQAHTWEGGISACTEADPPDGYCCGRYASYWNAFLLKNRRRVFIRYLNVDCLKIVIDPNIYQGELPEIYM